MQAAVVDRLLSHRKSHPLLPPPTLSSPHPDLLQNNLILLPAPQTLPAPLLFHVLPRSFLVKDLNRSSAFLTTRKKARSSPAPAPAPPLPVRSHHGSGSLLHQSRTRRLGALCPGHRPPYQALWTYLTARLPPPRMLFGQ